MPESFKAALVSYTEMPGLTSEDRAHLQRWSDDDRADEEWQTIDRAAQEHGLLLPPNVFITGDIGDKACRRSHRLPREIPRPLPRVCESRCTRSLSSCASRIRPACLQHLPEGEELARMLEDAARVFRMEVDPSRDVPGVVKVTRESDTPAVFTNQVSNYLKEITGRWLDDQAAVLTEIAFEAIGDVEFGAGEVVAPQS